MFEWTYNALILQLLQPFQNRVGGTTVAATMYLADMVGIRVFATGGLGGVHRGASESKQQFHSSN